MGHLGSVLRISHALLYIFTLTAGIACCICMGWTTRILSNCILYSSQTFSTLNKTLLVTEAQWGSINICSYSTFTAAVAAIYAIIWFWFYILMSDWKGGVTRHLVSEDEDGHPPDIKLLVPSLICSVLMFASVCVSTGFITAGSNAWCSSVEKSLKTCDEAGALPWANINEGEKVYEFVRDARIASWVLLSALGAKIILVSIRLSKYTATLERHNKSAMLMEAEREKLLSDASKSNVDSGLCMPRIGEEDITNVHETRQVIS